MQEPRDVEATLLGLGLAESMTYTIEQSAKFYWSMWGPLGTSMIQATEQWANTQRSYLRSLREAQGQEAPAAMGDVEAVGRSTKAAEEGGPTEAEGAPGEEIRSTIRESVRRSEEGSQEEETQAETTAVLEESQTDAEGLPLEDYDSLTVQGVTQRLLELNAEEIERLRDYEAETRNRRSLLERFDRRIKAARYDLRVREDLVSEGEAEGSSGEDVSSIIRESVRRSAGEEE